MVNSRRMAAKRAEIEAEVAARERKLALERKERARKFQEEVCSPGRMIDFS